jgi:hypothetical protein
MFEEKNPEVNLPSSLDIEILVEEFPSLPNSSTIPLKETSCLEPKSWVKIASKSCDNNSNIINNDRGILECERP